MQQPLQLSDFELGDTLGVGTVGTIYHARHKQTGQESALKILLPSVSEDQLIRARFRREMTILERISHPHIVKYLGGGRDGNQLFYAMEYVDSGSLKQVLKAGGPLRWREAASCAIQLCSALQHLHNHGIIHRDLKPGNLFFTRTGALKLGDFGIARDTKDTDLTADRLTVGTYAYMSPEQIRGDKGITGKTDLYALGCLLYEMLTGHPPYLGENFAQLFEQHLRDEPPSIRQSVPDCPLELDLMIRELMAKDPEKRPFNARTVQGRLIDLLEGATSGITTKAEDGEQDVAASAVDSAQRILSQRLVALTIVPEQRQVSWLSLAGLTLFIVGVVWAAWQLAG
ncbi:MAG: serine/threonine protein kinase [Pirellulaceae bacterium]|nr:serine/threonine protein kinase [Pirellulaceae bacterium]